MDKHELDSAIETVEQIDAARKSLLLQRREHYESARKRGVSGKALRTIVRLRREIAEIEADPATAERRPKLLADKRAVLNATYREAIEGGADQ